MLDFARVERMNQAFSVLLQELSATWPKKDIDYVDEEVGHREYEDALENLIALGLQNGKGFTSDQVFKIERLAEAIDLRQSTWLDQLREASAQRRP